MSEAIQPNTTDHFHPEFYAQQAEQFAQQSQWQAVISNYEKAIALAPDCSWYYYHLAGAEVKLANYTGAIARYRESIKLNPDFAWAHYHLGEVLTVTEKWQEAYTAYQASIKLNPDFVWSYHHLAQVCEQLDLMEEAIARYLQAYMKQLDIPGITKAIGDLWGKLLNKAGDLKNLIAYYQATPSANTKDIAIVQEFIIEQTDLLINLLDDLGKNGQPQSALIFAQLASQFLPEQAKIQEILTGLSQQQKLLDEMIIKSQTKIAQEPDHIWHYYDLAVAFSRQHRWSAAIETYSQAMQKDPDFPWWFYCNVWQAFDHENQLDVAEKLCRQSIQQHPDKFWPHLNLAEALTRQNNIKGAIASYETAGKIYLRNNYNQVREKLAKLAKLNNSQTSIEYFTEKRGPDFMILGVNKAGTTSLYNYIMIEHPQIIPPIKKELDFWSWKFDYSVDWYLAHFLPVPPHTQVLIGEASPSYIDDQQAATRIKQYFPQAKLIVILRNPVHRAISQYHHFRRLNWEHRDLETAILADYENLQGRTNFWHGELNYLARGVYVQFIKHWFSIFSPNQILVLQSEELLAKPQIVMEEVFSFLNLPNHPLPAYLLDNVGKYPEINQSMKNLLENFFAPYNQELELFLGRKFHW
jgi:tetratricopeptide (TPR) repeat protein